MGLKLFTGHVLPIFKFTIKDEDGVIVDLTSATAAKCHIRKEDATTNKFSGDAEDAAIQSPGTDGRINYTLPSGGIDESGSYSGQLVITFPGGGQPTERFRFPVEDGLS